MDPEHDVFEIIFTMLLSVSCSCQPLLACIWLRHVIPATFEFLLPRVLNSLQKGA
jgi:hypothetical protein